MDYIVVGGGIAGMMMARALVRRGASVQLIERGLCGHEASMANAGALAILDESASPAVHQLAAFSQYHYPALVEELAAMTGIDAEYDACGLLQDQGGDQHTSEARQSIDTAQLNALDPHLALNPSPMLWDSTVARLNSRLFAAALRKALQLESIEVIENTAVTGLVSLGGPITGVRTSQGIYSARHVVLATGAWSGLPISGFTQMPRVRPMGEAFIAINSAAQVARSIVQHGAYYLVPRRDGCVIVGCRDVRPGFNKVVSTEMRNRLYQFACACYPSLKAATVSEQWQGLFSVPVKGAPYIAPFKDIAGLSVLTGLGHDGLVLVPAAVELLCNQLFDEAPIVDATPFQPLRSSQ